MPMPKRVTKPVKPVEPDQYAMADEDSRKWAEARKREILRRARAQADRGDDPRGILEVLTRNVNALKLQMGGTAWRMWNMKILTAQAAVDDGADLKKVVENFVGSPERDRRADEISIVFKAAKLKAGPDIKKRAEVYEATLNQLNSVDQSLFSLAWQQDVEASKNK